ncbi:family 6 glucosyltransferase [Saccharospirillum sp. HFRX-1]|uniref:family 6 glucosyltransferase n=1 Tax=unclassified Saccharospirillum TaxID=2633430 RepID=UPI003721ED42
MNVSVFYVAIGNYIDFWSDFYKSCETNFLPGVSKQYFIFTDNVGAFSNSALESSLTVTGVHDLGWPLNTLLRFRYFQMVRSKALESDYCFFFNANAYINEPISLEEILPNGYELVGVIHPGYRNRRKFFLPYERKNKNSTAHVGQFGGTHYYQGCLNGGFSKAYMALVSSCDSSISFDLRSNYIARAHDESHLNKYFLENKPYSLPINYAMPEEWGCDGKIVMRDKSKFDWYGEVKNKRDDGSRFSYVKYLIKKFIVEKS